MNKQENFTVRMGKELKQRMKDHPEINWSHVIRENVRSMLDDLEELDQLVAGSRLTENDVEEIGAVIDAAATDRAQGDIASDDGESTAPSRSNQD